METADLQVNNFGELVKKVRMAKGMTLQQFYGPFAEHVSNFSAIERGKRKIGKRLSKDIVSYHQISEHWLASGEGEMFKQSLSGESALAKGEAVHVPFYNVDMSEIQFGSHRLFQDDPEYYVNFKPFNDCDAYLPIYGDSMYPKYASGEIIAIREIRNFDVILWGEAYLVVTNESANNLVTVKLLFEHANKNKLILRSSNPNFKGETVIDKAVINRMFVIKGKVTRNQL